jgi:hypothetical protein
MSKQKEGPAAGATARRAIAHQQSALLPPNYASKKRREAQTFASYCASGGQWHHIENLDLEILQWLVRLMANPEAVGIDAVTLWMQWARTHRTKLRWATMLEWQRVEMTARTLWRAYQDYLKEVGG